MKTYLANIGRGGCVAGVLSHGDAAYETPLAGGLWVRSYANSANDARMAHETLAKAFGQSLSNGETVPSPASSDP